MTPRILVYDIETAPAIGFCWAKWQTDVIDFKAHWYILSFAWKWLGDKNAQVLGLDDFQDGFENDYSLVSRLRELFDEADVTITHNGKAFDGPKANTRMLIHNMSPPSPYREIDTLQVARRRFAFMSNRLGDLCRALELDDKIKSPGFETWLGCMNGNTKSWRSMKQYNKRDVVILEQLYYRLRPWIDRHPNMSILADRPTACPRCSSTLGMQARGWAINSASRRRRFQCQSCGGWSLGRSLSKTDNQFVAA